MFVDEDSTDPFTEAQAGYLLLASGIDPETGLPLQEAEQAYYQGQERSTVFSACEEDPETVHTTELEPSWGLELQEMSEEIELASL